MDLNQCGEKISASIHHKTNAPIRVAIITKSDLSLNLIIPVRPDTNAATPDKPEIRIVIANAGLEKKVSPPFKPELTKTKKIIKNRTKATINPSAHFPALVDGANVIFKDFIIKIFYKTKTKKPGILLCC